MNPYDYKEQMAFSNAWLLPASIYFPSPAHTCSLTYQSQWCCFRIQCPHWSVKEANFAWVLLDPHFSMWTFSSGSIAWEQDPCWPTWVLHPLIRCPHQLIGWRCCCLRAMFACHWPAVMKSQLVTASYSFKDNWNWTRVKACYKGWVPQLVCRICVGCKIPGKTHTHLSKNILTHLSKNTLIIWGIEGALLLSVTHAATPSSLFFCECLLWGLISGYTEILAAPNEPTC